MVRIIQNTKDESDEDAHGYRYEGIQDDKNNALYYHHLNCHPQNPPIVLLILAAAIKEAGHAHEFTALILPEDVAPDAI